MWQGHYDGGLMEGLRKQRPEVPVILGRAHACARVPLYCPVKVREIMYIPQEKGWRIVAYQVPVAFFRVELAGNPADITFRIRSPALPGNRGEPYKDIRLLAGLKYLRLGPLGDIVGYGKCAIRAPAFCMHSSLRNYFTVKMRQLLKKPDVLQCDRATGAGGQ